jgi:hypothetical protein
MCSYRALAAEETPLCRDTAYAANVGFWVRASELTNALDQHLLAALRDWFQAEWAFDCVVFTISQQEIRQAALFEAAGLEQRSACTLWDGRLCWVFG